MLFPSFFLRFKYLRIFCLGLNAFFEIELNSDVHIGLWTKKDSAKALIPNFLVVVEQLINDEVRGDADSFHL